MHGPGPTPILATLSPYDDGHGDPRGRRDLRRHHEQPLARASRGAGPDGLRDLLAAGRRIRPPDAAHGGRDSMSSPADARPSGRRGLAPMPMGPGDVALTPLGRSTVSSTSSRTPRCWSSSDPRSTPAPRRRRASADERGQVVEANGRRSAVALRQVRRRAGDLHRRHTPSSRSRSTTAWQPRAGHRSSRCVTTTRPPDRATLAAHATPPRRPGGRSSRPTQVTASTLSVLHRKRLLEVCPLQRVGRPTLLGRCRATPARCRARGDAPRTPRPDARPSRAGARSRRRAPSRPRGSG